VRFYIFPLLFLIVCISRITLAQSPDALVVSASERALVKDRMGSKPRPLKRQDGLFAGQWVSCAAGCKELIISYCNVKSRVTERPRWRRIISINCSAPEGERGGSSKGEDGSLISPRESELIRPQNFSLRWKRYKYPVNVKLTIGINLGETIWGPATIDGTTGLFKSHSLRAALGSAQKRGDLRLVVVWTPGKELSARVRFKLISIEDEQDLVEKLRVFDNESDRTVKALGRATILSEYELDADAAREFEQALAIAQRHTADRETLIELGRLSILANYKAYNDERVKQLCKRFDLSVALSACSKSQ
jgi:hypothetical protein